MATLVDIIFSIKEIYFSYNKYSADDLSNLTRHPFNESLLQLYNPYYIL